jgi:drug/metabolite transporter (DMT)-like permease
MMRDIWIAAFMPPTFRSPSSTRGIVLLALVILGWGLNWPIMKYILGELTPLHFRSFCILASGIGLLLVARSRGKSISLPKPLWGKTALIALTNIVGWNLCAAYGLQLLPAGRSALIGYTMPMWTILFSIWLLNERFSCRIALAMALGTGGIVALLFETLSTWNASPQQDVLMLGALLMLCAAVSWGLGTVLAKRWSMPLNIMVLTGWVLIIGGIPSAIAAFWVDGLPTAIPSFGVCLGLIYNVLIGYMFCYWAWFEIVDIVPVSVASLSSLATPLIGIGSSILFLNEAFGAPELIATLLILGAIAVINSPARR